MRHRNLILPVVLLLSTLSAVPALTREQGAFTVVAVPVSSGASAEVRGVIEAPAERIAALVADPASFIDLLPASSVHVVGKQGGTLLVEVERREPWPVGTIRWTETLQQRTEAAQPAQPTQPTQIVERQALPGGYFRRLLATWRVTPLQPGRCAVSYKVWVDPVRWAPSWLLRRRNEQGMVATLERLQRLSAQPRFAARSALQPGQ